MIDYFISFFNNKHEEKLRKQKRCKQPNLFLLCLDNAEKIIENDKKEFLEFLADLNESCQDLRIIVTSNIDMG